MNHLDLEREIERMVLAMMTRNTEIGAALISNLKNQISLEEVAGVVLVSIERLSRFDLDCFFWAVEKLIPFDVMKEIKRMISTAIYQRLINKGFVPGRDISVDSCGQLMINEQAKTALSPCCLRLI